MRVKRSQQNSRRLDDHPGICQRGHASARREVCAFALEQNVGDAADGFCFAFGDGGELHGLKALNRAALSANEMRMTRLVRMIGIDGLKPPNVIAEFCAGHETCFGQVIEISKHRGSVESQRHQSIRKVRMSQRRRGSSQFKQSRNASRSRADADFANDGPNGFHFFRIHSTYLRSQTRLDQ